MPRLLTYTVRSMLTNPNVLFWGVAFATFWAVIGALVESSGVPNYLSVEQAYTSSWYGVLIIMSASAVGTSLTFSLTYQTGGLSHLVRYSKLKPSYYLISTYGGMAIVSAIIGLVLLAITYALFGYHFGYSVAKPSNIPVILADVVLAGLFFTALSTLLDIIALRLGGPRLINILSFIPLILGYLFGLMWANLDLGKWNYVYALSPFNEIEMLAYFGYYGKGNVPLTLEPFTTGQSLVSVPTVSPLDLFIYLALWIVILGVLSSVLLRGLYLVPPEEVRIL
nr:MAG: hypothetical protein TU35_06815 [Thermoproteus sp. AZ2]